MNRLCDFGGQGNDFFRAIDTDNWQLPSFRIDRPKGHSKDLFVLFKSPARVLNSGAGPGEEKESDVGPGWAIIYEKFMPQRYYPTDGGYFLHDYMHFETETEEEREALAALPLNKAFRVTFPEKITATVEAIRNELLDTSPDPKREILNSYGSILLQRLKNEAEREAYLLRRKEGGRELEEEEREILRRRSGWFKPLQTLRNEVYREPKEGSGSHQWSKEVEAPQSVQEPE